MHRICRTVKSILFIECQNSKPLSLILISPEVYFGLAFFFFGVFIWKTCNKVCSCVIHKLKIHFTCTRSFKKSFEHSTRFFLPLLAFFFFTSSSFCPILPHHERKHEKQKDHQRAWKSALNQFFLNTYSS